MDKKNNTNKLDGDFEVRHFSPSCCTRCRHFYGIELGTCAAYPNGIPSRFADFVLGVNAPKQQIHTTVQRDQVGDFILDFQ